MFFFSKIPWQFTDLEKFWFSPDFSLILLVLINCFQSSEQGRTIKIRGNFVSKLYFHEYLDQFANKFSSKRQTGFIFVTQSSNTGTIFGTKHLNMTNELTFLPPASEGWGKVMFSVCSHLGGGYPSLQHYPECHGAARGGYPVRSSRGGGYPGQGGYPAGGTLAGGGTQLGQHREYLLHGGRYASCVHAGGLSCLDIFLMWICHAEVKLLRDMWKRYGFISSFSASSTT